MEDIERKEYVVCDLDTHSCLLPLTHEEGKFGYPGYRERIPPALT